MRGLANPQAPNSGGVPGLIRPLHRAVPGDALGMRDHLQSRRLYIAELLRRQHAWESGGTPMQPLDYRVLSKRLRQTLAGLPESTARCSFADLPLDLLPLAAEVLETRHFERHGELFGLRAPMCRVVADALIHRLRQPTVD